MREGDLLKLVLDYLKLHRIFHWRNNTGAMFGQHKGKNWAVRFGRPGAPDIFAVRIICNVPIIPEILGIEVKGPKGQQSAKQIAFMEEFTRAGGRYILARSLEDVTSALS